MEILILFIVIVAVMFFFWQREEKTEYKISDRGMKEIERLENEDRD